MAALLMVQAKSYMMGGSWQVVRVKNYMALDCDPVATAGLRVCYARADPPEPVDTSRCRALQYLA